MMLYGLENTFPQSLQILEESEDVSKGGTQKYKKHLSEK